jgi:TPR repeat protein
VLWAAGVGVLAIGFALGVSMWQSGAQRQVLDTQNGRCKNGEAAACDTLRNLCLKRNGDACESLADALLAAPPERRDVRDAMHLLMEGCELRNRRACVTAGRKLLAGDGVAKDEAEASRLFGRACELGAREACGLKETLGHGGP